MNQNMINASQNKMMQSQQMQSQMNHGGHEVFDLHEVLDGMINVLDSYILVRTHVKDQELMDILERQYSFILDQYNITCECFQTGQDPSHPTKKYMMKQSNQITYGINPSQPKKPMQSMHEVSDQRIAVHMLGLIKSMATKITMSSLEATNPVVRRVLADTVPNYIEMAYEIFLYQNKLQQYQVPQLSPQDMSAMMQSYAPVMNQPIMQNRPMQ
ncbi:spore coat protein [Bacillus sp. JCM 19034]|uniref:spore coat protein n=1 Tax=Bacillus sp. JCM 19034 TaxID=1481928 RepID=UPI00351CFFF4